MVGIFEPACELLPPWTKELLYTCVLLPHLPSLWPPPPFSPSQSKHTFYTDSVWLWGGGVLSCVVDHILQEFNTVFLTRFRTSKLLHQPKQKWQKRWYLGIGVFNLPSSMSGPLSQLTISCFIQRQTLIIRDSSLAIRSTYIFISFRGTLLFVCTHRNEYCRLGRVWAG